MSTWKSFLQVSNSSPLRPRLQGTKTRLLGNLAVTSVFQRRDAERPALDAVGLLALLALAICGEAASQMSSADGDLSYSDNKPSMILGGQMVFFLPSSAGWGYWDADHQWRSAPATVSSRLEERYPHGSGMHVSTQAIAGATPVSASQDKSNGGEDPGSRRLKFPGDSRYFSPASSLTRQTASPELEYTVKTCPPGNPTC